jgi:hypothetical protein
LSHAFTQDYYVDEQSMLEAIRRRGHFNIIHGVADLWHKLLSAKD